MDEFLATEHAHTRYNPLNGQWVLVCPHRMKRPWHGQIEPLKKNDIADFDPENPLCPGAFRQNGERNPDYKSTFLFNNDFPALIENVPNPPVSDDPLFQMGPAQGTCKVMCFHPKTNATLPDMSHEEISDIINRWIEVYEELSSTYQWVQIFENKGFAMGCSNPHPHCQIWATAFIPSEPKIKDDFQRKYFEQHRSPLLMDYTKKEVLKKERIVIENSDWLVVVPYWAVWPFETMILPKTHLKRLSELSVHQRKSLAEMIKTLTTKYDNLFQCSFPYTMGWHGAPTGPHLASAQDHWTLHAVYYPPLLRSATVRKFMVGFELLAQSQRDLTAEQAAQRLREISDIRPNVNE